MKKVRNKGKGNKRKKVEKNNDLPEVEKNNDLPSDVLEFIFRELDFDDVFEFAGVCKSWRIGHKHYWTNFMESQSPLIVEIAKLAKKACSFLSVPDLKIYRSMMQYFSGFTYCGSSSGYLIMAGCDKKNPKLLLMNPFTRRKKEISTSALEGNFNYGSCRSLLAFAKGSKEFVIVVSSYTRSCSHSLSVYQSRNSSWVTYSTMTDPWKVVDFVVLHNTIYVLSDRAKIGVLSLNSARVKFLDLKNTLGVPTRTLRLVTCDGQLLVVQFKLRKLLSVHKIDFSTMEYVELETLGDLALFHSPRTNCYALSNPGRWGYDSNSVYHITNFVFASLTPKCEVYSLNSELKKCYVRVDFGAPTLKSNATVYWVDFCFRHLHNEVDYSLVD